MSTKILEKAQIINQERTQFPHNTPFSPTYDLFIHLS